MKTTHAHVLCCAVAVAITTILSPASADGSSPTPTILIPAVPAGQAVTRTDAETLAAEKNLQIVAANQTITSAELNLKSQRAPVNPTVGYSGLNNTVATTDFGNGSNYVGYVTLETSGRQHWRTSTARAQLEGSRWDARTTTLTVRQSVDDAYSALQVANAAFDNEQDVYRLTAQLSDLSDKQFKLGAAPETNAIRAGIAVTEEEQNLIAAANAVRTSRATLNVQMGRQPDAPVDAAEKLSYKPATIPPYEELVRRALANRPEIRSGEAAKWAAEAGVGMEQASYLPDVVVGKAFDSTGAGIGVVVPLDLGSISNGIRKAKSDVKIQETQNDQQVQQVRLDVENAYVALTQSEKTVASYEEDNGILPRSQSLLDRVTKGYSLGASTILDVIDAQQTYRTTRNSYFAAIGAYNQAVDQMNRAVGGDFTAASHVNVQIKSK